MLRCPSYYSLDSSFGLLDTLSTHLSRIMDQTCSIATTNVLSRNMEPGPADPHTKSPSFWILFDQLSFWISLLHAITDSNKKNKIWLISSISITKSIYHENPSLLSPIFIFLFFEVRPENPFWKLGRISLFSLLFSFYSAQNFEITKMPLCIKDQLNWRGVVTAVTWLHWWQQVGCLAPLLSTKPQAWGRHAVGWIRKLGISGWCWPKHCQGAWLGLLLLNGPWCSPDPGPFAGWWSLLVAEGSGHVVVLLCSCLTTNDQLQWASLAPDNSADAGWASSDSFWQ
jgi:hypothetical protein